MKIKTIRYDSKDGWIDGLHPELDSENTVIMVFAAPEYYDDTKEIQELAKRYPNSKIIGCSSAGEIYGANIYDQSIAVAITKFEKTQIKIAKIEQHSAEDSFNAGKYLAEQLDADDIKGIFVLSNGLSINGTELVNGLNTIDKKDIVITGGLAADGDRFKRTWLIYNGEVYRNNIIALGFYGDNIKIGHGSRGGWDIFGPQRRITRSKDNILFELDGKPALELYKEYLGDRAKGLPATGLLYPLAIRENAQDKRQLVRTILGIDEQTQSLIFAGQMPEGHYAQLMRGNFDHIIESAGEAGEVATHPILPMGTIGHHPVLAIAISCVGRRLLLGERTEEETESLLSMLPKGSSQVGFYSYGEISPYSTGRCDLHNQTMTVTTFYEAM